MLSSLASLLGLCKHRGLALQLEAKRQSWHRLISKGTWNGRPIAAEASASHYQELLPLAYPVSPALAPALGRCPAGPGMRWHAPAYGALQAKKRFQYPVGEKWCKLQGGRRLLLVQVICAVRYGGQSLVGNMHGRRYETDGS